MTTKRCFDNFVDADLAGDFSTRRSTSDWVGLLKNDSGTRISRCAHAKRQGQLGLSTPETEVSAAVVGAKRSFRLHMLFVVCQIFFETLLSWRQFTQ